MSDLVTALPGEETLLACWSALARWSPGARVERCAAVAVAVFPAWVPLNNAIVSDAHDRAGVAALVAQLTDTYADAGVGPWALWLPSASTDLDAPDAVREVPGLARDTTTLVMRAALSPGRRGHDEVARVSLAAVKRFADDKPVLAGELGEPETPSSLSAWVIVREGVAVAGAWTFLHDGDCGIYAVGTLPGWRRRGLARTLVEHVLADAAARGARTATLQSTRMGQPLYESLGFEPVGRYEEWVPVSRDPDAVPGSEVEDEILERS
jgi:ribosomal protein S18 acetylase RimI-like enzyme